MKTLKVFLLISIIAVCGLLVGCKDTQNDRRKVEQAFPSGEIQTLPELYFYYIIRQPDGSIWFARSEYGIFHTNLLFQGK